MMTGTDLRWAKSIFRSSMDSRATAALRREDECLE